MRIDFDSQTPIFQQISEGIEDAILTGAFGEGDQIPSITEFSVVYKINPATALKGINMLVDNGVLYKKRGVGMFVQMGAKNTLKESRSKQFYEDYICKMVDEAKRLGMTSAEVAAMIQKGFEQ